MSTAIPTQTRTKRSRQVFPPAGWRPAARGRRALAWVVDIALGVATLGVGWLLLALWLWGRGTTPGKRLLGLTVFAVDTRLPATRRRMAERTLLHQALAHLCCLATFGIAYLYVLAPVVVGSGRALYDDWARTAVLQHDRP